MNLTKLALAACAMAALSMAQERAKPQTSVTRTEHVDFPAGGVLRLAHATGEVTIEGWDRPGMEITTTKAPPAAYDAEWREKPAPAGALDRVQVTVERSGNQVLVATTNPRHSGAQVDYRIRIPRDASIIVEQREGEVHVADVTGDIHATTRSGEISLLLPPAGQYQIDARAKWGGVISDFPGRDRRRFWLVGHRFVPDGGGGRKLYLRAGYGDILIRKAQVE
jgi:hypothetical protein